MTDRERLRQKLHELRDALIRSTMLGWGMSICMRFYFWLADPQTFETFLWALTAAFSTLTLGGLAFDWFERKTRPRSEG